MKAVILAFLFVTVPALAQVAGEYRKKDGILKVKVVGTELQFSVNSNAGQSTCSMEETAVKIDETRAGYTSSDKKDMCVAILSLQKDGTIQFTSKDCNQYCGVAAAGSMDGVYRRKR